MTAFLAAIALFLYFGAIGYAITIVTVNGRDELRVLLAPTIGAAAIILIVMFVNYFGVPVGSFGGPLAAALLIASAAVIARAKAFALPRSLIPIGATLLGALVLTGRPFFEFGFDWVSYVNDDMSLYVSSARRIFEHGFLTSPDAQSFLQNRDASYPAYLQYVINNARSGSENLLAFVMAVLRTDGYRAYMPLMLALHLALISAATALTYVRPGHRRVPLAACVLLGVSALTTLGTEYQLIAQVIGLALFTGCLALLCSPPAGASPRSFIGSCALCAIVLAAEAAAYPELIVILGVAVGLFFVVRIATRAVAFGDAVRWLAGVALGTAVLLNVHVSTFANMMYTTLRFGTGAGARGAPTSHFPYYLIPSGLPDLFGILPIAGAPPEPWLSAAIALGAALLVVVVIATVSLLRRGEIAAFGSFAMLFAALPLILNRNDFGLFKLAMYAQPLFLPTMIMWWHYACERRPAPVRIAA
jgi:hypothetical protein